MKLYTTDRDPGVVPIGAILLAFLFFIPLGAYFVESGDLSFGVCGMKRAFDIPCLSCGSTRATLSLMAGNFIQAIVMQPLLITLYVTISIWGLLSLGTFIANRNLVLELTNRESLLLKVSILALPLLNWLYLIWRDI